MHLTSRLVCVALIWVVQAYHPYVQADLCGLRVERPADVETTAMGAAIAAGLGAGVWSSVDEVASTTGQIERAFDPAISPAEREARCGRWKRAVESSFGWAS